MKTDSKKLPKRLDGPKARIREVVLNVKLKKNPDDSYEQIQKISKLLKRKDKKEIIKAALEKHYNSEALKPYQAELIKMQKHLENTGKKMVILFDGRDASGKGGTIRRIIRYMNEKRYRVVALGKPSEQQKTELHMKRYIEQFPHSGEIVLFDRSWYNRSMVEPVMGFCTKAQYKRFMKKVVSYEQNFLEDGGKTILVKLYFSVTKKEQKRRFKRRKNDPLRQWKLSEVDLQAQELWDEFTEKKFSLLKKTHTRESPWLIIRSDNKHLARRETMKVLLNSTPYQGRSRKLDFTSDSNIVIPGDREFREMKKQRRKYGRFLI
ncbi:MAG: polyphosphate kinase 2 [Desulfobacterales bacterium]|nr:polyphosphate kinase 2 [Desulfobacterales bacterium]